MSALVSIGRSGYERMPTFVPMPTPAGRVPPPPSARGARRRWVPVVSGFA